MSGISFIHCGDLHLGCQQFNDETRYEDFFASFSYIIDYAIEKQAGYLLIAGDLFHHRNVNARTLGIAVRQLERLKAAGIKVIAIEGNHDKAFYVDEASWMSFLNNQGYLRLLKPVFQEGRLLLQPYEAGAGCILEEEGIRLIGLGYLGATTAQRLGEASLQLAEYGSGAAPFTVLLLHAAVDKLMGQDMAGVGKDVFAQFEGIVDYIALGHIHSRQEQGGWIFNPGAPESVHIDEVRKNQEKGFYHVIADESGMKVEHIASRRRPVLYFDIDLTGIQLPEQAAGVVAARLDTEGLSDAGDLRPIIQVNIFGKVDFNSFAIEEGTLSDMIKSRYDCLAVEVLNNVNLERNAEALSDGGFDRASVERGVIMNMIVEERPEYRAASQLLAELVLKTKSLSLADVAEDEIIDIIGQAMEGLVIEDTKEAAE
ncbi:MAG: exonuclease SbcCD subunit D [Clostridiales bacterium]|nr:exonuclease SbcCD subunit D [Clostridiales bacterium]